MEPLTSDEARVLGVLIEKELTVPGSYPLTLNGIVDGASQKSNRDPVEQYDEDRAQIALDGLRAKGMVVRVDTAGSRVPKFRHQASEKLTLERYELVVLAELLLRGPQTLGELRGRASRMHNLESIEFVRELLVKLAARELPLAQELPPSPGSRAERWVQLLAPDAHPLGAVAGDSASEAHPTASVATLHERIAVLESQVGQLKAVVGRLAQSLGEADPFGPAGG